MATGSSGTYPYGWEACGLDLIRPSLSSLAQTSPASPSDPRLVWLRNSARPLFSTALFLNTSKLNVDETFHQLVCAVRACARTSPVSIMTGNKVSEATRERETFKYVRILLSWPATSDQLSDTTLSLLLTRCAMMSQISFLLLHCDHARILP